MSLTGYIFVLPSSSLCATLLYRIKLSTLIHDMTDNLPFSH